MTLEGLVVGACVAILDGYTHGGYEVLVLLHCLPKSSSLVPTTNGVLLFFVFGVSITDYDL